ncbi:372_t:CDS:1 [Diversispora eburnea]|uniref:ribonuclease III n=1 Tax=Diversispora eburnea TaxID=1213867 RepID=A0A9N8Z6J9_9GLOM|nr:372_t:CDS:1 [Diversispora eburnea]
MAQKLELHVFEDINLLREALTHRTYCYENPMSGHPNERLEFLGDSVISCIVADYIHERFPEYNEGQLTQLRAKIVCQETLALFTEQLGLNEKLRMGAGSHMLKNNEKIRCDTFEAYVGAIFLDVKKDLMKVMEYMKPLIEPYVDRLPEITVKIEKKDESDDIFNDVKPSKDIHLDSIGSLQTWAQRKGYFIPLYSQISRGGTPHDPIFRFEVRISEITVGTGSGKNKQSAKKQAATDALNKIKDNERDITDALNKIKDKVGNLNLTETNNENGPSN